MQLSIEPIDLHLRHRFTTHVDSRTVQHSHIIRIEADGIVGLGEVTAHPFYSISREKILADFEHIQKKFLGQTFTEPDELWHAFANELKDNTFLLSGIDVALNDLYGKMQSKPLHVLWGGSFSELPVSSYTIGIDTPKIMLQKMRETPWSNYKIKLGTAEDIAIIKLLRKETDVPFRIDANCAWDEKTLLQMNDDLADMNIEFIEQPIHPNLKEDIIKSSGKSKWPLVADESFKTLADLEFCAAHFDVINIKLVKCGGLTPARKIIQLAKEKGLKIMIGCMTESSISISAVSQLLPWVDYADLDGALLISNDVAEGTVVTADKTEISESAGIGARLNRGA